MPSTSMRKTEYDPESRDLSVWFVASGKRYAFEDVPPRAATILDDGKLLKHSNCRLVDAPPPARVGFQ